jgi:hypothetical protein
MSWFHHSAEPAEMYALAPRFPLGATLISVLMTGSIGSAVLMLLSQG